MVTSVELIQATVYGLLTGGIYALVALGLTLIFGVMNVVQFAHGEYVMLGMYATYWLAVLFGLDPLLSLFITLPLFFVAGMITQKILINPIIDAPHWAQISLTLGLSIILQNLALLFWTGDFRGITTSYSRYIITMGFVSFGMPRLLSFVASVFITGALYFLLTRTELGRALRATAQNRDAARLVGIDVTKMNLVALGIASAVAAGGGALLTTYYYTFPTVGNTFILIAFCIVVLGGMGSFRGAFVGSLIVGVVESLSGVLFEPSSKLILPYFLFVLILVARPQGLFGKETGR